MLGVTLQGSTTNNNNKDTNRSIILPNSSVIGAVVNALITDLYTQTLDWSNGHQFGKPHTESQN